MARDLRSAADAMRRAAASGDSAAFSEARAAAERLSRARDGLEQQRSDRMARDIDAALSRTRRLAERAEGDRGRRAGARQGRRRPRRSRCQQLLAAQGRRGRRGGRHREAARSHRVRFPAGAPAGARKVQEAADAIRDDKLKEKIRYSRGLVQGAPAETAAGVRGADWRRHRVARSRGCASAADAVNAPAPGNRADAMARARGLARGVGSMEQRLREQQQRGRRGGKAGGPGSATGRPAGRQDAGGRRGRRPTAREDAPATTARRAEEVRPTSSRASSSARRGSAGRRRRRSAATCRRSGWT